MTWNAVQSCTCIYGITVKSFASLHFISLRQTIISSRIGHITRWLGVVLHKHAATRSIPGLWFILVGSRCVKGPIHAQTNLRNSMLYKRLSIHDTISLRKLQSLGKCHNENMSRAACLATFLAYATKEETVYRKRKMSIWTKIGWKEVYNCINSCQNSLFAVVCDILKRRCERCENQWWTGDVVQQLANMSVHTSNCCTNSRNTPHTIKQFAQQPVFRKLFDRLWGS